MKIRNRGWLLLATLAVLVAGLGASDDKVRIGIVDVEQAVTSTKEGKAAREELERKIKEAEAVLQPMADRFQELAKEIETKQFVLSEDALRQKRLDIAELQNQILSKRREIEGQLQVERERLIGPIREKFAQIIAELGRKEGFTLILQRGAPGVMYTRESLDITDMVVDAYNRED